eukprot:8927446-Pyramimonas_sp.AAC.1
MVRARGRRERPRRVRQWQPRRCRARTWSALQHAVARTPHTWDTTESTCRAWTWSALQHAVARTHTWDMEFVCSYLAGPRRGTPCTLPACARRPAARWRSGAVAQSHSDTVAAAGPQRHRARLGHVTSVKNRWEN